MIGGDGNCVCYPHREKALCRVRSTQRELVKPGFAAGAAERKKSACITNSRPRSKRLARGVETG